MKHLAAVSNDPMGKRFSNVTHEINGEYCLNVATEAKEVLKNSFLHQAVALIADVPPKWEL